MTAQAAILRMGSDEPGPGQVYALETGKAYLHPRQREPAVTIGLRWCPAHMGVAGKVKADEWAKLAADEPGARGVYGDRPGVNASHLGRWPI
jgi:hypothetical protein